MQWYRGIMYDALANTIAMIFVVVGIAMAIGGLIAAIVLVADLM